MQNTVTLFEFAETNEIEYDVALVVAGLSKKIIGIVDGAVDPPPPLEAVTRSLLPAASPIQMFVDPRFSTKLPNVPAVKLANTKTWLDVADGVIDTDKPVIASSLFALSVPLNASVFVVLTT